MTTSSKTLYNSGPWNRKRQRRPAATCGCSQPSSLGIFVGGFIAFAAWNGTWYQTWKALHVLAAIVWVGGGVMIQLLALRIMRANDPAQLAKFAKDVEAVSLRAFIPASLVLLALGFVLMDQGGWEYKFWVVFALAGFGLSFLSGILILSPETGRIGKLIEEREGWTPRSAPGSSGSSSTRGSSSPSSR